MSEQKPRFWRTAIRDWRVLSVIVLVLLAALIGGAYLTVATFTASSASKASIGTGDVVFALTPTGAIVDTTALRPGVTKTGQVQIANQKATATFTLGFSGIGSGPLVSTLQFTVAELAPQSRQLYSGPLSAVQPIALGQIAKGGSMQLGLTFAWSATSTSPDLQGQSVPLVLHWDATT